MPKNEDTKFVMPTWLDQSESMTQEELMTALDSAFYAETGMMGVAHELSDLVDTHATDDFQHWKYISFFEWVLRLSREHDNDQEI